MLQALPVLRPDSNCALDGLAIHVQRCLFAAVFVELDVDHLPVVGIVEDDVDVDGGGEEVRHRGRGMGRAVRLEDDRLPLRILGDQLSFGPGREASSVRLAVLDRTRIEGTTQHLVQLLTSRPNTPEQSTLV